MTYGWVGASMSICDPITTTRGIRDYKKKNDARIKVENIGSVFMEAFVTLLHYSLPIELV